MGADVSSERGRYPNRQAQNADFERRYREMYGEDLSREDLIERYRMEKLKADRKKRLEEAQAAYNAEKRHRSDDEHMPRRRRSRSRSRSRERESDPSRRRREDNMRIISQERDRRQRDTRRNERSHRSRGHRENGRTRREHRSRHRKDSSRERDKTRRRSSSASSEDARKPRESSTEMKSSERHRESRSKRKEERSSKYKEREGRERSRKRQEEGKQSSRSRSKHTKDKSDSDSDSDSDRRRSPKVQESRRAIKPKEDKENVSSNTLRSKKRKNKLKVEHYKSAPDLTESKDREYGRGAWSRAHDYFDGYEHRPQSWVEQIATERNSALPAPVMERQIIYSLPQTMAMLDGAGYPLTDRSLPFSSISQHNISGQLRTRPKSLDMSLQEPQIQTRNVNSMQTSPTAVKTPAGSVPAVSPNVKPNKSSKQKKRDQHKEQSSRRRNHVPESDQDIPQRSVKNSTLRRSNGPTPKPRVKSPLQSPTSIPTTHSANTSPQRSKHDKKGRITSISAREDFESMLASDYGTAQMMSNDFDGSAPTYPGNYRPNQEIFVDDVIFRNHTRPNQKTQAKDDSDTEGVTDEEHVLTLGEDLSPFSYSSGFDLEIPEGFNFDSDTSTRKRGKTGSGMRRKSPVKASEKSISPSAANTLSRGRKSGKDKALVFTSLQPVSKPKSTKGNQKTADQHPRSQKSTSVSNTKRKQTRAASSEQYAYSDSSSISKSPGRRSRYVDTEENTHERKAHQKSATLQRSSNRHVTEKRVDKRVQHPSDRSDKEKIIVPSQKGWSSDKVTHDVGVGTLTRKSHAKSASAQSPKRKQPSSQPVYYLKPISTHEVFIEDSIVSQSETDVSRQRTISAVSDQRSTLSGSRSPTISSYTAYTEQSEFDARGNLESHENPTLNHTWDREERPSVSSAASFDPEPVQVVQPAMKLGIYESIKPNSYKSSGGRVMYITRSRHGSSPPPSIRTSEDSEKMSERKLETQPSREDHRQEQGEEQFDAQEVGKWVLDCYVQDQKLKSNDAQRDPMPQSNPSKIAEPRLTKQNSVEYQATFTITSEPEITQREDESKVVPLTREALHNHDGNTSHYPQHYPSSTEFVPDFKVKEDTPTSQGVFQQNLGMIKNQIRQNPERQRTPEPAWKSEQYKSKLNHWNNSPTSNVVLAEVCSVNDTDDSTSTSSKKSAPAEQPRHDPPDDNNRPRTQIPITKNTRIIRPNNHRLQTQLDLEKTTTQPWRRQPVNSSVEPQKEAVKTNSQVKQLSSNQAQFDLEQTTQPWRRQPSNSSSVPQKEVIKPSSQVKLSSNRDFNGTKNVPTLSTARSIDSSTSSGSSSEVTQQPEAVKPFMSNQNGGKSAVDTKPVAEKNQWSSWGGRTYGSQHKLDEQYQQKQAPAWSKKPSEVAHLHNRQPYLERIANASKRPYQNSWPPKRTGQPETVPKPSESKGVAQNTGANVKTDGKRQERVKTSTTQHVPPQKSLDIVTGPQSTSDSDSETCLSSSDSSEIISPKRTLREALLKGGRYDTKSDEEVKNQSPRGEVPTQAALPKRNPTPGPRRGPSGNLRLSAGQSEDWRVVGQRPGYAVSGVPIRGGAVSESKEPDNRSEAVKANNPAAFTTKHTPAKSNMHFSRSAPIRGGALSESKGPDNRATSVEANNSASFTTKSLSTESNRNFSRAAPLPQNAPFQTGTVRTGPVFAKNDVQPCPRQSLTRQSKSSTSSKSSDEYSLSSERRDNPFKSIDSEEIDSIVDRIPGRTAPRVSRSGSESDIMEKLEKSRATKKQETLEERTARILGIHRKASTDDSSSDEDENSQKPERKEDPKPAEKKDLNAYMNNLLTGAADVSPGTKQKYLGSVHGTSPLVTNSRSSSDYEAPSGKTSQNRGVGLRRQDPLQESDDQTSQSGSDISISKSLVGDETDGRKENGGHTSSKGQTNVNPGHSHQSSSDEERVSPVSPHHKMLMSYGNNIYADTPGFHKHQPSYESTESEENYDKGGKEPAHHHNSNTSQASNHARTLSQNSSEELSVSNTNSVGTNLVPSNSGHARSPSREAAKVKIAKSIGFELQTPAPQESLPTTVHSDEYEIKILSASRRKTSAEEYPANGKVESSEESVSSVGSDDRLQEVMQSIGLNPSDAWTMSV